MIYSSSAVVFSVVVSMTAFVTFFPTKQARGGCKGEDAERGQAEGHTRAGAAPKEPQAEVVIGGKVSPSSLRGIVRQVNHLTLRVKDLEASRRFYVDIIGFKEIPRPVLPRRGLWLWMGNIELHLNVQTDKESAPQLTRDATAHTPHLALEVDNIHDAYLGLKGAGLSMQCVVPVVEDKAVVQYFVQDPDGHVLEICDCHRRVA